jgi:hypothetical protein
VVEVVMRGEKLVEVGAVIALKTPCRLVFMLATSPVRSS